MRISRVVSLLAFAVLGGCLELEQTVVLGPDGAGRQTLRLVVPETALTELERASAAAQLGGAGDLRAVFDKDAVGRELAAAGLSLVGHAAERLPHRRKVDLAASFPDFGALQRSPLAGSAAEWVLAPGPRAGTARLSLYLQGKAAWTEARAKAAAMAGGPDEVAAAFFRKRQEALSGLDLTFRLQLPGDLLVWTANMEKTGPREVTARITAEQIRTPQDLVRRLAPRFEVVFDATGCKLPL